MLVGVGVVSSRFCLCGVLRDCVDVVRWLVVDSCESCVFIGVVVVVSIQSLTGVYLMPFWERSMSLPCNISLIEVVRASWSFLR